MSVQRQRHTLGAVATLAASLAAGCSDPVAKTDLRPEGDPEVLSVLVMNDSDFLFLESATYCATGDNKRPGLVGTPLFIPVQICDDDLSVGATEVTDALPSDLGFGGDGSFGWYVRIMFDELLDPDVEELIPILDPDTMVETGQFTGSLANTQPVTLTCNGTAVPYDGYYSPSGNNVTWPLGPSLFIAPTDYSLIATGSECTVEIKDSVVDKDNNPVPSGERGTGGEYKFQLLPLELAATDPEPAAPGEEAIIVPDTPALFLFNHFIDPTTLATSEVVITEHVNTDCSADAGDTVVPAGDIVVDGDSASGLVFVNLTETAAGTGLAWKPSTNYSIAFAAGNEVADVAGGKANLPEAADLTICFNTDVAP